MRSRGVRAAAFAGVAGAAAVVFAAAGDLDTGFGTGGIVRTSSTGLGEARDAAVQSDGKVIVVGKDDDQWRIIRYASDGTVDTSYGTSGQVDLFGSGYAHDVVLDSSGRAVVAGFADVTLTSGTGKKTTTTIEQRATVVRLTTGGSLDTSFGTGGVAHVGVSGSTGTLGTAVALRADGKIVVGGTAQFEVKGKGGTSFQSAAFVARLTTGGALDTSFGSSGVAVGSSSTSNLSVAQQSLAVQSDDKIVALVGQSVVRWTANGSSDSTFSSASSASGDTYRRLTVDGSDRILVSGWRTSGSSSDALVVRYTSSGSSDSSFASGSGATMNHSARDEAQGGLFVQGDGKIVFSAACIPTSGAQSIVTMRLNGDGTADSSFGTGGMTSAVAPGTQATVVRGDALAPNGKIVTCGSVIDTLTGGGSDSDWLVMRHLGE